jgi:hypothetical protein
MSALGGGDGGEMCRFGPNGYEVAALSCGGILAAVSLFSTDYYKSLVMKSIRLKLYWMVKSTMLIVFSVLLDITRLLVKAWAFVFLIILL